jgi:enamine deaminase RidA (YjgF/YER057c/UK114 family)
MHQIGRRVDNGAFRFRSCTLRKEAMTDIERLGAGARWSDLVIHNGVARWVEVADDPTSDARDQVLQVLAQIDATLARLNSRREQLLEVLIFLADLRDAAALNELWDAWVPAGHAPIRACVQAGLSGSYRVEMIVQAAT